MKGPLDFDTWDDWLYGLDGAWVFLLILALVIVVVGFWSRSLRSDKSRQSKEE